MSTQPRDRGLPGGWENPARRTIQNKITGETVYWEKLSSETKGEYASAVLTCAPGGGPPLHYHTSYAERFETLDDPLQVTINGKELEFKPGEAVDVPIGTHHRFHNEGDKDVKFRGKVLPGHLGFEQSLFILFGLCNDGLSDEKTALPKSLLHTAVVANLGDMRFPGISGMMMNNFVTVLASYARWTGVQEELLKKYWDSE